MTQSPCNGTGGNLGGNVSGIGIALSGKVYVQNTNTPVCAMVLANGTSMFGAMAKGTSLLQPSLLMVTAKLPCFLGGRILALQIDIKPSSSYESSDIDMKSIQECHVPTSNRPVPPPTPDRVFVKRSFFFSTDYRTRMV